MMVTGHEQRMASLQMETALVASGVASRLANWDFPAIPAQLVTFNPHSAFYESPI
jgi:hypothetical protein